MPGIRRIPAVAAVVGGIIAATTALFGAYVGYRQLQDGVTVQDWSRRTTALCEKDTADLRAPLQKTLDEVANATALVGQGDISAAAAKLARSSRSIQSYADAYRSFIGQVRELDPPAGDHGDEVTQFLDAGSAIYQQLDLVSRDLQGAAGQLQSMPAQDAPGYQDWLQGMTVTVGRALTDLGTLQRVTLPNYERAVIDRGLTQCPGWNATGQPLAPPPTATTTPTPRAPGELSVPERALARRVGLPPRACRVAEAPSRALGALAELNCTVPGLASDPAFLMFDSVDHLRSWFAVKPDQPGDCGAGDTVEQDLPADSPHPGRMRCFPMADGGFRVELMLTDELVGVAAQAAGPSALQEWVTAFLHTPSL